MYTNYIVNYTIYNSTLTYSCVNDNFFCFIFILLLIFLPLLVFILILLNKKKNRKRNRIYDIDQLFKKNKKKDDVIRNCIICHDNISFENLVILRCNHYYHKECIKKWLRIHMICPVCRADYNLSI